MSDGSRLVGFTAVFILCSILLQSRYARRTELLSEALCWFLLPFLIELERRIGISSKSNNDHHHSVRQSSLWMIAGGIAVSCLCKAEADILWIMVSKCR
jgi:hypothetical protein